MLNTRISFGGDETAPDRLVWADAGETATALPDGSVDVIYVDPPFGTGTVRRGRATNPGAATGPDKLALSYRDVPDDPTRFVQWLLPCLTESRRVLRATGSLFVHLDYRAVHYVKVALDELFGRRRFVNELVWCYSVGGKSRRTFGRKHDTILWYARGADYAFFPDRVRVPRKGGSHMRVVRDENGELVQEKTDRKTGKVYRYPVSLGKIPEDWWTDIEILNRGEKQRTGWPTQKPERLLERIIKGTAPEGAVVADWFSGSGTTAVVAQRLGHRFVCSDESPDAIRCARDRLKRYGELLAAEGMPPRDISVEGLQSLQSAASS